MVRLPDLPGASAGVWQTILPLQLIPARGRKHFPATQWSRSAGLQLIPARGRKPLKGNILNQSADYNISPQGDGNVIISTHSVACSCVIATYPRKGTETAIFSCPSLVRTDCNLSPQGDGNSHTLTASSQNHLLQHIPARGRKHDIGQKRADGRPLQLIPARGRKLYRTTPILLDSHVLQLIPARGHKKTPPQPGDSGVGVFPFVEKALLRVEM